ncbi:putative PLP-dependent enzyme possibly involved in cell wall biogenesis [Thioflavicoccus mobilis 8321]|uniref:Putative PLP-dependent enzyme possibly involved in cell wall biogenesis n=1 Tax=Thioflavicoccus mobilis 8321 TaxID=765912 RepID=L0GXS8_9GAMM|nr:DegT/DnrJ/EryC1/StrS family aminotransferase [Thioflavicoccus mobilis]AGA90632.1 putative PLP-dependent enzyme possibly involved in cell wall biogenesis [Thioflavicoccus mobilis 8321]
MNILLATDIVVDICASRPEVGAQAARALRLAGALGHRVWLYVGAVPVLEAALVEALKSQGVAASDSAIRSRARVLLKDFVRDKQWLAALAGEGDVFDADDLGAAQLVAAVARFAGDDILLLTHDEGLLARQDPRIQTPADYAARFSSATPPAVGAFIDLKAQQDHLRPAIERSIHTVLHHGQYVLGPEVVALEARLADYVGVEHCVAAASGTDTLLIALMALGVGPGDEVVTTPFTFIATGEMIAFLGAKPVFVDIDPKTYNLDPAQVEAAITPRTRAIMPVSLYGQCPEMDAINAIAARHGLPVVEDAAQSFGATYRGRRSGGLSTIGSTSFFPAKPLGGYGEGGALFTDDAELAKALREIRVHGQDRRYHHARIGLNGRLDTLQAAILLAKLDHFDWEVERRAEIGARYTAWLNERCPDILTPHVEPHATSVFAQYTVQVTDRDRIAKALGEAGIPTAIHYPIPLHGQPAFAPYGYRQGDFPVAEAAAQRVMSLPMHPDLPEQDQRRIVDALCAAVSG